MKKILILALAVTLGLNGMAQTPAVPVTQATPAPETVLKVPTPTTNNLDFLNPDKLVNPKDGTMVDPDAGTLTWKGKTFDIGTSRLFRARFERYLNLNQSDILRQAEYRVLIDDVLRLLSPQVLNDPKTNLDKNIQEAYTKLYKAAEYPVDGGTSKVLAHMIFNTWRLRDEIRGDNQQLTEYQRALKKDEGDMEYKNRHEQWEKDRRAIELKNRGISDTATDVPSVNSPARKAEANRALIAASNAGVAIKGNIAKFQFQSQIVYLILNRRFEHALMASNFYRLLFRSSAQQIEVGLDLLTQFLPKSDLMYTVEALEQLCQEAINDVTATMQTIDNSYAVKDLTSVQERLQETFHLGEFLEPVTSFNSDKRREVLQYYRLTRQARELATLKDFDRLAATAAQLKELSADFKYSEAESFIQTNKQASNLAVASGKYQLAKNDFAGAQTFFKEAASIWPLNPELKDLTTAISNQTNAAVQMTQKFDDLMRNQDFRGVFNQRHEMGLGLSQDADRAPKLKTTLDLVAQVDMLLGQAKILVGQNNPYGAWEAVLEAEKLMPRDVEVFTMKSTLLTKAVDYAKTLEDAKAKEDSKQLTASLALYIKALDLYPASVQGTAGKTRVSALILDSYNP